MAVEAFAARFGNLSDEAWLQTLIRSVDEPVIDGIAFPAFPDAKMQSSFVGAEGRAALEAAFDFYKEIKQYARRLGIPLNAQTRALDFGCGWGRHYRFFLRELKPGNYVGVDIDPACIETCRWTIPMGSFEQCEIQPPLRFGGGSFDLIYAYSVFSHLSEKAHLGWIEEFARILRPGGMLVVSTMLREHLGVWQRQSTDETKPWCIANLKRVNFDYDRFQAGFDSGQFLYCPTGGGGIRSDDFYGEAIISPAYARGYWAKHFKIVDYLSYPMTHPQALIVCQRN